MAAGLQKAFNIKNNILKRIGFMQGRMLPMVGKKIQAFPVKNWEKEFYLANISNFSLMEWTLDYKGLNNNPLMQKHGQMRIKELKNKFNFKIPSVTCDFFMQKPFFLENTKSKLKLLHLLEKVIDNSINIGVKFLVIPVAVTHKEGII